MPAQKTLMTRMHPVAQVDTVMAATAITDDGKTAGTIIDNAQTRVSFDKDGN